MEDTTNSQSLQLELGTGPYRHLHKNLRVQTSRLGKGIFVVDEIIPRGSVIYHYFDSPEPTKYTFEEIEKFSAEEKDFFLCHCFEDEEGKFYGPRTEAEADLDFSNYWNHSCDPNCWYLDENNIVARRDIQVGEEATIDYGTFDKETIFVLTCVESWDCACGAQDCRKKISPYDYKDEKFRNKYFPHFNPYFLRKIDEYLKEQDKEKTKLSSQ